MIAKKSERKQRAVILKRIFAALLAMVVGAGTGTVALAAEAGVPTAVSEATKHAERGAET